MTQNIDQLIAEAVERAYGGYVASAAKRGRRPEWPYVPIVKFPEHPQGLRVEQTRQLRGLAYTTRAEAVARAARQIEAWKVDLADKLARPNFRALREQYGLPREVAR